MVPMSSTARAKVKLEMVVGGHSVCGVDPCGAKQVVGVALVSAKELDCRETGSHLGPAEISTTPFFPFFLLGQIS